MSAESKVVVVHEGLGIRLSIARRTERPVLVIRKAEVEVFPQFGMPDVRELTGRELAMAFPEFRPYLHGTWVATLEVGPAREVMPFKGHVDNDLGLLLVSVAEFLRIRFGISYATSLEQLTEAFRPELEGPRI